jgi:hypothetical protein
MPARLARVRWPVDGVFGKIYEFVVCHEHVLGPASLTE